MSGGGGTWRLRVEGGRRATSRRPGSSPQESRRRCSCGSQRSSDLAARDGQLRPALVPVRCTCTWASSFAVVAGHGAVVGVRRDHVDDVVEERLLAGGASRGGVHQGASKVVGHRDRWDRHVVGVGRVATSSLPRAPAISTLASRIRRATDRCPTRRRLLSRLRSPGPQRRRRVQGCPASGGGPCATQRRWLGVPAR